MGKINTKGWKPFPIIELFEVKNTHSILKNEVEEDSGETPYVTASNENNGVSTYISYNDHLKEPGNCIMIGGKTLTISYQKDDFYSNDSHNLALYLKNPKYRTEKVQLFLVTALKASIGHIYSWGNSISSKSIQKDSIMLPIGLDGKPNYSYMAEYMENQEIKACKTLINLRLAKEHNSRDFPTTNFTEFKVEDLFIPLTISKKLSKKDLKEDGTVPVHSSEMLNNGIIGYSKIDPEFIVDQENPMYLIFGDHTKSMHIADYSFSVMDNVKVLKPKINNTFVILFITTIWGKAIPDLGYARHWSIAKNTPIKLPATPNNKVDIEYIEAYMKKLHLNSRETLDRLQSISN